MQNKKITEILAWLLIVLFAYTGGYKVFAYSDFNLDLHKQIFPESLILLLSFAIPFSEVLCLLLLLFIRTRLAGFTLSTILLATFTLYVAGAVLNIYLRVPCSCGGALRNIGWGNHLIFNLVFLFISCFGTILTIRGRRLGKNK